MTILDKIKRNAELYPNRIMMNSYEGEFLNELTWKQLDEFSDILAAWIDKNCCSKRPVMVYGHKHPLMVVCFIASVKSGRAYCPIDVNVPLARVEAIHNELRPDLVLATEDLNLQIDNIIDIDKIRNIINAECDKISSLKYVNKDDVFYIIFTSGSTGTPKGVQITTECLDNFISWAITLGSGRKDNAHYTYINQAPFSFDLSVMDLFLCMYTGGTLCALSKSTQNDAKKMYELLEKSKANVWVSTPSFADVCLAEPSFDELMMPNITDFLFCGEILTNKTVDRLQKKFPKAKIVNTYGPTESTCAVTEVIITPDINNSNIPLPVGKAKPGTRIIILDESGNIVPEGEKGEIVIVGDSVSIGYLNNPTLNEKHFGVFEEIGGVQRLYKTGDEGYLKDEMLFYCGRIDLQVKMHGYRIELGDIENNLLKIPGIGQAIVVPKYRDAKVTSLVAGVIMDMNGLSEKENEKYIKQALRDMLPDYMIPKKIKFLDNILRTNNGKIDRKAMATIL